MNALAKTRFDGRRILVVEDEYVIAMEIAGVLEDCGAEIVGPVGSVGEALDLVSRQRLIDGAVLDVNLGGERVFPVARLLAARSVPYLFVTGYDALELAEFPIPPKVEKPADPTVVATTLRLLIDAGDMA